MSEFTKIPADEPVVVPAHEEETYDDLWIKNLRFISKDGGDTKVAGNLIPYNGTDVLEGPITPVVIDGIFTMMQDEEVPAELRAKLAAAMETILVAVVGVLDYQKTLVVEDEPEVITEPTEE